MDLAKNERLNYRDLGLNPEVTAGRHRNKRSLWRYIWLHRYLYFMIVPVLLYYALFHYLPL